MNHKEEICYLCGKELDQEISRDHVPPKQFYPRNIRKDFSPNLFTLPVHITCNKQYQSDEDYFVNSIAPLTKGSFSGNEIWKDISNQFKRPQGQRIGQMVLNEFQERPSGLYLPGNKVVKRFDPKRVWRVVWKITRGLFYKEYGRFLPELSSNYFNVFSVNEKPPDYFDVVRNTHSRGQYPGVFDYKFICIPEINNFHLWAMLFWDRLIKIVAFHDPDCVCASCQK